MIWRWTSTGWWHTYTPKATHHLPLEPRHLVWAEVQRRARQRNSARAPASARSGGDPVGPPWQAPEPEGGKNCGKILLGRHGHPYDLVRASSAHAHVKPGMETRDSARCSSLHRRTDTLFRLGKEPWPENRTQARAEPLALELFPPLPRKGAWGL